MNRPWSLLIFGLLLSLPMRSQAEPIQYDFNCIADTSGLFEQFSPSVPLNNSGTVAFVAILKNAGAGIFKGSGASIATIADATNRFTFGFSGIAINDFGTVAFPSRVKGGGVGIFAGNGGPITTIADSKSGIVAVGEPVSINNSGTVTFLASEASPAIEGLFSGKVAQSPTYMTTGLAVPSSHSAVQLLTITVPSRLPPE
jgi:hypothetical protein